MGVWEYGSMGVCKNNFLDNIVEEMDYFFI
jgi:hypothetical protein